MSDTISLKEALESPESVKAVRLELKKGESLAELARFKNLESLTLREVPKGTKVPRDALAALAKLKELSISAAGDEGLEVPEELFELPIEILKIWDSKPGDVVRFKRVTDLWVVVKDPNKDVEVLAQGLPRLTRLEIWGSHLKKGDLSPAIGRFGTLEHLALVSCGLRTLPKEISQLGKLKNLELRGLPMDKFPAEICSIRSLEFLQFNQKTAFLPDELADLPSLRRLDLTGALNGGAMISSFDPIERMKKVPAILGKLPALEALHLDHCGVVDLEALTGNARLKELFLSWNGLPDTRALETLTGLEVLDLNQSAFLKEMDGLARLKKLRKLNLESCDDLKSISFISELPALQSLNIDRCKKLGELSAVYAHPALTELEADEDALARFKRREELRGLPNAEGLKRAISGAKNLEEARKVLRQIGSFASFFTSSAQHGLAAVFGLPLEAPQARSEDEEVDEDEDEDEKTVPRQGLSTEALDDLLAKYEGDLSTADLISFYESVALDAGDEIQALTIAAQEIGKRGSPEEQERLVKAFRAARENQGERERYADERSGYSTSMRRTIEEAFPAYGPGALAQLLEEASTHDLHEVGVDELFAPALAKAKGEDEQRILKRFGWWVQDHSDAIGREHVEALIEGVMKSASPGARERIRAMHGEILLRDELMALLSSEAPGSRDRLLKRLGEDCPEKVVESLFSNKLMDVEDKLEWSGVQGVFRRALPRDAQYLMRQCMEWLLARDVAKARTAILDGIKETPAAEEAVCRQLRLLAREDEDEKTRIPAKALADELEKVDPKKSDREAKETAFNRQIHELYDEKAVRKLVKMIEEADFEVTLDKDDRIWHLSHGIVALYHEEAYEAAFALLDVFPKIKGKPNSRQRIIRDFLAVIMASGNQERLKQVFALIPTNPAEVEVDGLAFNLACYAAKTKDREGLFKWTARSIELGKARNQFVSDGDFKDWLADPEFQALIAQAA